MGRIRIHLALFTLTVLSTLFAGAYYIQDYDLFADFPTRVLPGLVLGIPFSLPLLIILGGHEFAHYFNSRRHNVDATLPYFIPFPNLFGTLGAVIKMKSRIRDRRALIDIGASGPLVGFILAVFACVIGISMSQVYPKMPPVAGETTLGGSILYYAMIKAILGVDPTAVSIKLHPVAVAGWVGLFVTSINLMPVGQLDGGHISFAFLGKWHRTLSLCFVVALAAMGVVFTGWLIWAVLLIFIGTKHPPVMDPYSPIGIKRILIGIASLIVFIITFPPVPVSIYLP